MLKRFLAVALIAACGSPSPAPVAKPAPPPVADVEPAPAPADPADAVLPLWPEVKKGTLPNGLTYYILQHGKPEKRGFLWLAVNAGSVLEDDDQRGLAHFDEHMAFNGTKRFPKNAIIKYLESIGMRFGADLNAYTNFDETVYQLEVPTDDPKFVATGFDILRDWAADATYDGKEVDSERGVVGEEWRLGRGAGQRIFDKQSKVLFAGSRYADRLTIGLKDTLDKAPREALYRFYKDWYRPDLMAVIAVGDFADTAQIEKQIQERFGDLKNPANERPRIAAGMPKADGTRVSIVTDKEMPGAFVAVYNLVPHRPESSMKDFRRIVVEEVYAAIINERFALISRRADAPFAAASAGPESYTREIDAFARQAQVKNGRVLDALRAVLTEVVRVEQRGFTQTELDRARANIQREYEQLDTEESTSDSRAYTTELTRNFFEKELMIGRKREAELTKQYLGTVTLAELSALGKSYGAGDNRVVTIAGSEGGKKDVKMPTEAEVLAVVDDVTKLKLDAWEDKPAAASLMAALPKPGKIVKEKENAKISVTEWTLSNGARVIVKPTDYEADSVLLAGLSPGGLAVASNKAFPDARFADDIAGVGGVGELDLEALSKSLTGKHVTAQASVGDTTEGIEASASSRDLETMFQLVYLEMTAPRKDDSAIATWRANTAEQLANRLRVPDVQFQLEQQRALFKGAPRRMAPEPDDIAKVNADKALAFYKDRFGDASDFTFVLVGSFDLAKARALTETYLASLPAKGRKEKEKDLGIRPVKGVVDKTWQLGQDAKAHVTLTFHADETWSRDRDRDMYLLGQVLSIRLREVLREDKGGVYGVGAGGFISRSPHPERSFVVSFGCDPARVDELTKAVFDQIAALEKDGVSDEYLEKIKTTFTREREVQLRNNGFWLYWLQNAYKYGDDPAAILDPSGMLGRATSANIVAAAKRYLDPKQYFRAVMVPAKAP